ncbi:PepSY-like domain-containing protein [Sphingobacterium deserti]|uniref:Putative beta-lactamase-inhibitor-like PepSY-like domain-containing protein n=1 Tax=Sphingobacterium deserti TaxID=1229276 RepID=A0A0B8T789_9SPHI|nr:PepSY-like domain-containing protein [Sphingobacterium deserti]KGE13550.1 hypothetical protein DI53_2611 [Sphingobacterium deserti]
MNLKKIWIAMLIMLPYLATVRAADKPIPFSKLPQKAQQFFEAYFSHDDIVKISVDNPYFFGTEYEVVLKDGSKIEFASQGDWLEVKMKNKAVPLPVVPKNIMQYLKKSFPDTFVTSMKKKGLLYKVKISNALELEFSRQGKFLRFDD